MMGVGLGDAGCHAASGSGRRARARVGADRAGGASGGAHLRLEAGVSSVEEIDLLKRNLVGVEKAWRDNDSQAVYDAYQNLAQHFVIYSNTKRALFFYTKCLELAVNSDYLEGELEANLNLGLCHEKLGDIERATEFHEAHLELALSSENQSQAQDAYGNLVRTYQLSAGRLEESKEMQKAVDQHNKCLEAARVQGDQLAEALVHFRIGNCMHKMGEIKQAIEYFETYLNSCIELRDKVGEGKACCALADAYKDLNDIDESVRYLEMFLDLAKSGDPKNHANACANLGFIYYSQGKFDRSVTYFEKFFEVSRGLGDKKMVDNARVSLGVARGKANFKQYLELVNNDMASLLQWKNVRMPMADLKSIPK